MARKTLLTPEVMETICAAIRQGAFDHVAAQAAGIGRTAFYEWLQRGENGEEPYAEFANKVMEAKSTARKAAEAKVFDEQPFNWLRYGPGRERPGEPGWTSETTVNVQAGDTPIKLSWGESDEATATD